MKAPLLIFGLALPLRLYWVWHRYSFQKGHLEPLGDEGEYARLALNLRYHHVFSLGESLLPTTFRAPLYPAFIAVFNSLLYVLLAQAILGAITCVVVYLVAKQHFDQRIALVAGMMMALAPMSAMVTGQLLTETLFTFFVSLGIYFWGRQRYELAGAVLGLAALTHHSLLMFLMLLLLLALTFRRREILRLVLFAALVIAPWTIRNVITTHRLIPIAHGGWGTNILFGTLDSGIRIDWGAVLSNPAVATDRNYYDPQKEMIYFRRGIQRITAEPLNWLVVRTKQYPRLFIDVDTYMLPWFGRFGSVVKYLFVAGNILLPLLTLWSCYLLRHELWEHLHLPLYPVFIFLMYLPLWTESRYTLAAVPMMIILSLYASSGTIRAVISGKNFH